MKNIEWADQTWNPLRGCANRCWANDHHPEGNCYAAAMARRNLGDVYGCAQCSDQLRIHFHPERLDEPRHWRKPRWVFCGSMTDLWTDEPPIQLEYWRHQIFEVMAATPQHDYIILTKRPDRIRFDEMWMQQGLSHWDGANLVIGVSVTKQDETHRIQTLLYKLHKFQREVPDRINFRPRIAVSFEPLLEFQCFDGLEYVIPDLDWVIVGAATGYVKRMYAAQDVSFAANQIVSEAHRRDIPVFVKPALEPQLPVHWRQLRQHPARKEVKECSDGSAVPNTKSP